jgi:hypothetical protein
MMMQKKCPSCGLLVVWPPSRPGSAAKCGNCGIAVIVEPTVEQALGLRGAFRQQLEVLLNQHSQENESNTPDYILARYMTDALDAFDRAVNERERWHGRLDVGPVGHGG